MGVQGKRGSHQCQEKEVGLERLCTWAEPAKKWFSHVCRGGKVKACRFVEETSVVKEKTK